MTSVATKSAAVEELAHDIALARSLMGGTTAMRKAGTRHLPRFPNEDVEAYDARLATSTLFPAYSRTVSTLAAKPFAKPVTLDEKVPEAIKVLLPRIDSEGRNLDQFAAQVMERAVGYGIAGILVDYPPLEGASTLADQQQRKDRPYWVLIEPWNIIGWRAVRSGAMWTLSQLRIGETITEEDGAYGERVIEQVRVLEPGRWETHRKDRDGVWALYEQGFTSTKEIPFVPVYGRQDGFMVGRPPLIELAHLNVEHWQSASDQRNILHVARVPILTTIGADEVAITVGASSAIKLPMGSSMQYVEHTGSAVGAGREDLQDLQERMRQAGAELLVLAPGDVTATQVATENAVGLCALQRIALGLQDALNTALQLTANWLGLPEGGTVELFDDYAKGGLAEQSSDLLLRSAQTGMISKATYLDELQRRGILSADVDVEEELEAVEAETEKALRDMAANQPPDSQPAGPGAPEPGNAPPAE